MKVTGLFRGAKENSGTESPRQILPELSVKVRLRVTLGIKIGDGDMVVELPTVVQEVQEGGGNNSPPQIIVNPPQIDYLPEPLDLAIEQTLLWPAGGGQLELPVIIAQTEDSGWKLTVTGETRRLQRREYVRVDIHLTALITVLDAEGEVSSVFSGDLLDLCEGGTRCLPRAEPPPVGSHVVVEFEGEDQQPLRCPGSIVRHVPAGKRAFSEVALAIRFDDPEVNGDSIRRMVFAQQLRTRRVL